MGLLVYKVPDYSYTAEREQYRTICEMLRKHYADKSDMCLFVANYNINDCELDGILFKNDAVISIEFKNYGGKVTAVENGSWTLDDGTIVKGGSREKSPYQQAKINHINLKQGLKDGLILPQSAINNIPALIVFNQPIQLTNRLSGRVQSWLHITDNEHFLQKIQDITVRETDLSNEDIFKLVEKLNLYEEWKDIDYCDYCEKKNENDDSHMITPEQYEKYVSEISQLAGKQRKLTDGLEKYEISKKLQDLENSLVEGRLRVLVMGKFSSGKSTFLNALMGQKILPAAATPTTAVIGEIQYADNPGATLFYNDASKNPMSINVEDLEKHIVIDYEAEIRDGKETSPYSKVVVKYPLEICKPGIELVDSPGLDDPTCHDAITLNYLPSADAIVYCMNVQQAFGAMDKTEIEHIRALGYNSIVFVLTYFDMIELNDTMTGDKQAMRVKSHYTEILKPYTDLGENGIFFVGSVPALNGKLRKDDKRLQSSHLPEAEKKLYEILFNERGRLKLIKAICSVKQANRDTQRYISDQIELFSQDKTALANKISLATQNIERAKQKADLITQNLKNGLDNIVKDAKLRAESFFETGVISNIENWVKEECKPQSGISIWSPKESATAYAEECAKFIQTKIETVVSDWCRKKLVPEYIEPKLLELGEQLHSSLEAFKKDIDAVRINLSLPDIEDNSSISGNGNFDIERGEIDISKLFSIEDLMPVLISQVVSYAVLSIVGLFTGVGIIAYIIGAVVALVTGGYFGKKNIEEKVKQTVAEKAKEQIKEKQHAFVDGIAQSVQKTMDDNMYKTVKDKLDTNVNQYEQLLNDTNNSMTADVNTIETQIAKKKTMLKDNELIANELQRYETCFETQQN